MAMAALAFSAAGAGCAGAQGTGGGAAAAGVPKVYMFEEINSENLVKIYEVLGREASGKVAVKLSTGEPGGHNYLQPALIEDLVRRVNGTIVECNTAYGGGRADTEAGPLRNTASRQSLRWISWMPTVKWLCPWRAADT